MRPIAFLSHHLTVAGITALLLTAALGLPASAGALDDAAARATLRGIKALRVLVASLKADISEGDFTTAQLQTDVEARLKQAAIPADPRSGEFLYVAVTTVKLDRGVYAYSIDVDSYQSVTLARAPTLSTLAATWGVGSRVGVIDRTRLREIRSEVVGFVDQFISAYREQNPKQ